METLLEKIFLSSLPVTDVTCDDGKTYYIHSVAVGEKPSQLSYTEQRYVAPARAFTLEELQAVQAKLDALIDEEMKLIWQKFSYLEPEPSGPVSFLVETKT